MVPRGEHESHYRIYDLSNFTSNCAEQRGFLYALAEFFIGTEVTVMDEREGPITRDMGELLYQYIDDCVVGPLLTYERYDEARKDPVPHGVASLLGIFGNLMSCTVAHFTIVAQTVESFREINIAGDDGLVPEDPLNSMDVDIAIRHVGDYSRDKCFRGDEQGAICLKRPFVEDLPRCFLKDNIVPPSLAVTDSYLHPEAVDPRYDFPGLSDMTTAERISVIGKDLLRFFQKAYELGYGNSGRLESIWAGYRRAVGRAFHKPMPLAPSNYPFWPPSPSMDPECSPQMLHLLWCDSLPSYIPRLEYKNLDEPEELRYVGQSVECNSDARLSLFERLGYVEKEEIRYEGYERDALFQYWYSVYVDKARLPPVVYRYSVNQDIPAVWF